MSSRKGRKYCNCQREEIGSLVLIAVSYFVDSLVDSTGRIQIPGIYDSVAALTEEERKLYESIGFDLEEHRNNCGVKKFLYNTKVT